MDSHLLSDIYKVVKVHSWSGTEYSKISDNKQRLHCGEVHGGSTSFFWTSNIKMLTICVQSIFISFTFECNSQLGDKELRNIF